MRILDRIKRSVRSRVYSSAASEVPVSLDYKVLNERKPPVLRGWEEADVAERQHQSFVPLLQEVQSGRPRLDFQVAAQAIIETGLRDPLIIEVGCGSGYYSQALPLLVGRPLRYIGIDYSSSMTSLARSVYPEVEFVTGDACHLPIASDTCDILLSGTSLMHIADFRAAIDESVRATRSWCIFHTVPVMSERATTMLTKQAYGKEVIEVIFNKDQLESIFAEKKLVTSAVFESIPYDVSGVVGERTWTLTYLCRKS